MHEHSQLAEFGELHVAARKDLETALRIREGVVSPRWFESWIASYSFEEPLEALVQPAQNILQDLRIDPTVFRERFLQLRELILLVIVGQSFSKLIGILSLQQSGIVEKAT